MKKTKLALFHSLIALLLCVSMFVGTTFAWFTDEVTSMNNIIQSGRLDVELEYRDANGDWQSVDQNTNVFDPNALWEPGHTEVVYLRVSNKGNLALKYELGINVASQTLGTNVYGNSFKLSDYIEMGAVAGKADTYATRQEARNAVTTSGTLSSGYVTYGSIEANAAEQYIALVVFMPEDVDNVANYKTGTTPPTINLGITLLATQMTAENDSFGNNYDEGAKHPRGNINFSSTQSVADLMENGALTQDVTVGNPNGDIYAEVPSDVKLADSATSLELTVQTMQNSEADIKLENGETATSLDVHMDGVDENNTVPMLITLKGLMKTGLNSTSVALYHVEDGVTVPMTMVTNPVNHNEFSYDPATGDVVMALASFSEVAVVSDTVNAWDGTTTTAYSGSGIETDPYLISTAEQLAYFRNQVDDGKNFEGEFVQLSNDINLNSKNFDPIGWGYVNNAHNRDAVAGKVFMGTFDGNGKTIYNLYQNGWDLEVNGADYTYTNCGFGLFSAASGATFKDLTISGAKITVECVEAGILVGLSQGNCTYDNIKIYNSKIANYQRPAGGLIGEISGTDGGTTEITDVTIGPDVVVGSLWGDFDTPVGGVIGARWLDGEETYVTMENVTVAARLDVYSDVTAAYQWYAYRRAGMLIGNTDTPPADGKHAQTATADFLTCTDVTVYYGDWVNYHYCEFTNENNPGRNYPWVRVEAGENCSAYSNPRYGQPLDVNGNKVVDANHKHQTDDTCKELIKFGQLYGGGQGVYGRAEHAGVEVIDYLYSVTFVNNSQVMYTFYATEDKFGANDTLNIADVDDTAVSVVESAMGEGYEVDHWMNAGSTAITTISKSDSEDLVLYPSFKNRYTASFVDWNGNILAWDLYVVGNGNNIKTLASTAADKVPAVPDCTFNFVKEDGTTDLTCWEVHVTADDGTVATTTLDKYGFNDQKDITIYPVYTYNGDVNLIPVDNDGNGTTDEYQVGGYSNGTGTELVEIPASVNGIKVTSIVENAFSSYEGVHAVVIPTTIVGAGNNILAEPWGIIDSGETVTIYYGGSYEEWKAVEPSFASNWESGISSSTRIFFLNHTDYVDRNEGYLQFSRGFFGNSWGEIKPIDDAIIEEYTTKKCNCGLESCWEKDADGNYVLDESGNKVAKLKPDSKYWITE